MGLHYSFNIITDRHAVDMLLRKVAASVTARDRNRLLGCIPFTPALRDLRRDEFERGSDICLALLVEPTSEVLDFVNHSAEVGPEADCGLIPVGCVWTSLRLGERFACLSATAATSAMSRLFAASPAVQAVVTRIALRAACRVALLSDESEQYRLLWPVQRTIDLPAEGEFPLEDEVDGICAAVLSAAELPPGGPSMGA